ncbi:MAG TPA: type II toxin-antitoxin system VapC family toxin [Candidatus Acidoferrales bacterium]
MIATIDTELTVVDSSGWVAYLGDAPEAEAFGIYLEREDSLVVPTIVIYEVVKKLKLTASETTVHRFLSHAYRCREMELDSAIAIAAARISIRHRLAMADAIIYATAESAGAQLVTSDTDFRDLPGVIVV